MSSIPAEDCQSLCNLSKSVLSCSHFVAPQCIPSVDSSCDAQPAVFFWMKQSYLLYLSFLLPYVKLGVCVCVCVFVYSPPCCRERKDCGMFLETSVSITTGWWQRVFAEFLGDCPTCLWRVSREAFSWLWSTTSPLDVTKLYTPNLKVCFCFLFPLD